MYNKRARRSNGVVILQKQTVFISYASADLEQAETICAYLERQGKACWIAPRNSPAGTEYGEEIIKGIENSDLMVLVFSASSNTSQHVLREVERAVNKKMPVIAFKIEDAKLSKSMEYFLSSNQWLDATTAFDRKLEMLNDCISLLAMMEDETETGVPAPVPVTNKAIPIMLGVIAVGVLAIALTIALTSGKDKGVETSDPASDAARLETVLSTTTAEIVTTTMSTTTASAVTTTEAAKLPTFQAGDFLTFGKYYPRGYAEENKDEEIKWQILSLDAAAGTAKQIAAEIIDIKPFDCAESGMYQVNFNGDTYDRTKESSYTTEDMRAFYGGNDWETSDLRAWLNAEGAVEYVSMNPCNAATDENGNSFGNQRGFLDAFTKGELARLLTMPTGNNLTDRVCVPSMEEVEQYAKLDFFQLHPSVTKSAIASDTTSWYKRFGANGALDYLWVTRTPVDYNAYEIMVTETLLAHDLFSFYHAASSGFGIRPVITIRYAGVTGSQVTGSGTNIKPYHLTV